MCHGKALRLQDIAIHRQQTSTFLENPLVKVTLVLNRYKEANKVADYYRRWAQELDLDWAGLDQASAGLVYPVAGAFSQ